MVILHLKQDTVKQGLLFVIGLWSFIGISQSDIQSIGTLPQNIKETSGLIFYNGSLITHNDSGNAAELYALDPETLQIIRTIRILNAENIDWEDIAQDSDFIYIGDIGNNRGDRQDLGILKITKSDFDTSDEVNAERITFLYEDQTDFTPSDNSDFDAEALFVLNDDLIVLTKQWQSQGTVAYTIPKVPGAFLAERLDSYQVDGLVTGADYDVSSNTLYLVGYSQFLAPFFVEISDVSAAAVFGSGQIKTGLDIGASQVEALTFFENVFYVTSEEFISPPLVNSLSQLFTFSLDDNNQEEEEEVPNPNPENEVEPKDGLVVYKPGTSLDLNYELNTDKAIFGMGIFDSNGRMVKYTPLERITQDPIDISGFSQGLYFLTFFYDNKAISSPFFRD
jgi:hypothetical protein